MRYNRYNKDELLLYHIGGLKAISLNASALLIQYFIVLISRILLILSLIYNNYLQQKKLHSYNIYK